MKRLDGVNGLQLLLGVLGLTGLSVLLASTGQSGTTTFGSCYPPNIAAQITLDQYSSAQLGLSQKQCERTCSKVNRACTGSVSSAKSCSNKAIDDQKGIELALCKDISSKPARKECDSDAKGAARFLRGLVSESEEIGRADCSQTLPECVASCTQPAVD